MTIRIISVLETMGHKPINKNEFIYQYNIISNSINQGDSDTYILIKASEINAVILKERELVEDFSDSWLADKDIAELKLIKLTLEEYEAE